MRSWSRKVVGEAAASYVHFEVPLSFLLRSTYTLRVVSRLHSILGMLSNLTFTRHAGVQFMEMTLENNRSASISSCQLLLTVVLQYSRPLLYAVNANNAYSSYIPTPVFYRFSTVASFSVYVTHPSRHNPVTGICFYNNTYIVDRTESPCS